MATSPRVHESRVIPASVDKVWTLIRSFDFSWWKSVVAEAKSDAPHDVFSVRTLTFKDGTVQKIKILEISDLEHFLTYEIVTSEPPVQYSSAIHTIRLREITFDKTTFAEWLSDYSGDASQAVIQDSRFKRQEAFADLIRALNL